MFSIAILLHSEKHGCPTTPIFEKQNRIQITARGLWFF